MISGAAVLKMVMSGVISLGYCAKLQPVRIDVTSAIAAIRANANRRSQRLVNAAIAQDERCPDEQRRPPLRQAVIHCRRAFLRGDENDEGNGHERGAGPKRAQAKIILHMALGVWGRQ